MNLGKYEIISELGRGGFGVVYEAKDLTLERMVALKVLHPQLAADVDFVSRFQTEAKSLAKLDHSNIVTIHEFGEVEGRYFIAMRYLPGGNLAQRIKTEGALPFEETLRLARQLVAGLNYAHAQGLIHRDMKPANILFDQNQNAVISDFGLAKVVQSSTSASSSMGGVGVGTPYYKAPEVWRGKQATKAADQYSLACILVEMLTGKVLFDADSTPTVMLKHFEPLELPESLPKEFHVVITKALSKEPHERYKDLDALLADFEAAGKPKQAKAEQPKVMQTVGGTTFQAPKQQSDTYSAPDSTPKTREVQPPNQDDYGKPVPVRQKKRVSFIALLGIAIVVFGGTWFAVKTIQDAQFRANLDEFRAATAEARDLPLTAPTSAWTTEPIWVETLAPTSTSLSEVTRLNTLAPTNTPTNKPSAVPTQTPLPQPEAGSFRIREKDGMEQVYVPAGSFSMGSNEIDVAMPIHEVYLDAYWIDKFEVTNAQYEWCVAESACITPHRSDWYIVDDSYYGNSKYADYPVIYVDWNQAKEYCEWAGGRLPTEAEWEKAARGDKDTRTYPWGDAAPNCILANAPIDSKQKDCVGVTSAVGSYPDGASPYGVMDMAGNVWEWVSDWYREDYYGSQADWSNPIGPTSGKYRVLRGGSAGGKSGNLRVSVRGVLALGDWYPNLGFRCVGSP